jgi:hypothetical protein
MANKELVLEKEVDTRAFARLFEKCVKDIDLLGNTDDFQIDFAEFDYKSGDINVVYHRLDDEKFPKTITVCITRKD